MDPKSKLEKVVVAHVKHSFRTGEICIATLLNNPPAEFCYLRQKIFNGPTNGHNIL